jgi:hypothetical protein
MKYILITQEDFNRINISLSKYFDVEYNYLKVGDQVFECIESSFGGKPNGQKGMKKITTICPHCNIIGAKSSLKRYHFNNCKSLNNGI